MIYSISACQVLRSGTDGAAFSSNALPSVWRTNRSAAAAKVDALAAGGMDDYEIPAFLRKLQEQTARQEHDQSSFTPEQMLEKFNELSLTTTKFSDVTFKLTEHMSEGYVWKVLCDMAESKEDIDIYWACLIWWLSSEVRGLVTLNRHASTTQCTDCCR